MAASSAAGSASIVKPFAERAIADLIVILQKQNESGRRQIGTGRAA